MLGFAAAWLPAPKQGGTLLVDSKIEGRTEARPSQRLRLAVSRLA